MGDAARAAVVGRMRLIGITDCLGAGGNALSWCEPVLCAGLAALMLRDHGIPDSLFIMLAQKIRAAASSRSALLIMNRPPLIVADLKPDVVHIGRRGGSIREARAVLGEKTVLGYSSHSLEEARAAFDAGADYVFFSPAYNAHGRKGRGLASLARVVKKAGGPVIALGGIGPEQVEEVMGTGAHGIAVSRAIFNAKNPAAVASRLATRLRNLLHHR